jgi:hypothetical protein
MPSSAVTDEDRDVPSWVRTTLIAAVGAGTWFLYRLVIPYISTLFWPAVWGLSIDQITVTVVNRHAILTRIGV